MAFAKWTANDLVWERMTFPAVSAGRYMDGFLQAFSVDKTVLERCVRSWAFLLEDPGEPIQPVAVNAYGAIAFLTAWDDDDRTAERLHIMDPLGVSVFAHPELNFGSFIEGWVPRGDMGLFLDDSVYRAWRLENGGRELPHGNILGVKTPLTLGGTFQAQNFQEEPFEEYYHSRGEVYRKALRS